MLRIELEYINNNKWEIMNSFTVCYFGIMITIPKGFKSDLASTPKILWSIYPPFGKYINASIIHDYLYTNHLLTRSQADYVLLHEMKNAGINKITCYIFYISVRLFGNFYYSCVK